MNTSHSAYCFAEPTKWAGSWKIGGNLSIMVSIKPTEQQIKNTEEMFGWEWFDAEIKKASEK